MENQTNTVANKEVKEYNIKCYVKERTAKNGVKFTSYSTYLEAKKQSANLAFTKEVAERPTKSCLLIVDSDKVHRDLRAKGEYPKFWIHEIKRVEALPVEPENLDDYFEF